jgi:hypothetical protein
MNYQRHKKCDELITTQAMQPTNKNKNNVTNLQQLKQRDELTSAKVV